MASYRLNVVKKHLQENSVGFLKCSSVDRDNYIGNGYTNFRYTLNNPTLTNEQRNFYEKNGYIVISDLVGDEILDQCSTRFIDICDGKVPVDRNITLMKDTTLTKKGAKGQHLYYKFQDILCDEVFIKYYLSDKLLDIVECFTGPNIRVMNSMLINKPPSKQITSIHPPHQDLYYFPFRPVDRIIGTWTAIDDATIENGCLNVIPGSHTGPLLQHGYPESEVDFKKAVFFGIQDYDESKLIPLEMKRGETVFFHPLLIHGSGTNASKGFRKAIVGHFVNADFHFVNVKGTVQEKAEEEILKAINIRGIYPPGTTYYDIWRFKSKIIRGQDKTTWSFKD